MYYHPLNKLKNAPSLDASALRYSRVKSRQAKPLSVVALSLYSVVKIIYELTYIPEIYLYMASFDSTGSTLSSTTLEGAVMEICQTVQDAERAAAEVTNNMAVNYFSGDNTVQISAVLPFEQSVSGTTGQIQFVGTDYIDYPAWTPGGDVQSTSLAGATLELLQKLQVAEKASSDNPDIVTFTYYTETGIATAAAEFGIAFNIEADGAVKMTAVEYLPDA